jgi:hypothetical protein
MSRIEINAGGRHVIVDHDGELEPIRAAALSLWQASESRLASPGPAVGFTAERRGTYDVDPTGNGRSRRSVDPVIARGADG